jgi:hypothetical protein
MKIHLKDFQPANNANPVNYSLYSRDSLAAVSASAQLGDQHKDLCFEWTLLELMFNSYPNVGVKRGDTGAPDYFDRLRDVSVFESAFGHGSGRP